MLAGLGNWVMGLLGTASRRTARQKTGAAGESCAAKFLRRTRGMRILTRNVKCARGELDLVALDGQTLVFVEVRCRADESFGTPEQSLTAAKRRSVVRAARWFIRTRRLKGRPVRFDVVAVVGDPSGKPTIRHIPAAFGW